KTALHALIVKEENRGKGRDKRNRQEVPANNRNENKSHRTSKNLRDSKPRTVLRNRNREVSRNKEINLTDRLKKTITDRRANLRTGQMTGAKVPKIRIANQIHPNRKEKTMNKRASYFFLIVVTLIFTSCNRN